MTSPAQPQWWLHTETEYEDQRRKPTVAYWELPAGWASWSPDQKCDYLETIESRLHVAGKYWTRVNPELIPAIERNDLRNCVDGLSSSQQQRILADLLAMALGHGPLAVPDSGLADVLLTALHVTTRARAFEADL